MAGNFAHELVSRAVWAVVAGLAIAPMALAEDKVFQGGSWNDENAWSPTGVPGPFDRALLPASQAGNVTLGGGFDLEDIVFDNASNYHLQGAGELGKVRQITSFGSFNEITLAN